MKAGVWITLIIAVGLAIIIFVVLKYRSAIAEIERPKSWWEDLGITIGLPGFSIGGHL